MELEPSSARRLRFSFSLLSLLLCIVLLLPSFVSAQSDDDECITPLFPEGMWEPPRFFSMSTAAPLAKYYRENPDEGKKLTRAINVLHSLVNIMDTRRANGDESACNLQRQLDWVTATGPASRSRQIIAAEVGVDEACPSRLDFTMDESREDFNSALDPSLRQGVSDIFREAVLSSVPAVETSGESPFDQGLANWTRTVYPWTDWDLRHFSQQCAVESASAYRVNGKLYIRVGVTNLPVDVFALDYDRQIFEEWVKEDFSDSLRMIQPELIRAGPELDERDDWVKSSTLLEKWSAKYLLASNSVMFLDDNPAVTEALRQNAVAIDLAEDAIAPSNIAILALPLTMNLIPVAFLAELSTAAMLAYIIFTDVFSTLPFLVKGVELIRAVDNERRETVAFYMGNRTFGEIEVWTASCKGEDKFHAIGVSFVVIAVLAIAVGILLEVFAGAVMRRRRQKDGSAAEGPFGRAAFDVTKLSLVGSGTERDGLERRYSIDADEIGAESDTETRPSSNESMDRQAPEENRWWRWGSPSASPTASVMTVKMMPSRGSDVISADVISRDETYFSGVKDFGEGTQDEGGSFMNRLKRLFMFFTRSGDDSQDFTVGVGIDGMSSAERAERAARGSGSDGYGYGYDEEGEDREPRRDSSMV